MSQRGCKRRKVSKVLCGGEPTGPHQLARYTAETNYFYSNVSIQPNILMSYLWHYLEGQHMEASTSMSDMPSYETAQTPTTHPA